MLLYRALICNTLDKRKLLTIERCKKNYGVISRKQSWDAQNELVKFIFSNYLIDFWIIMKITWVHGLLGGLLVEWTTKR